MAKKTVLDKLSIFSPQTKIDQKPVERLMKLSAKKDRSINYLVIEAILEHLKREERSIELGPPPRIINKAFAKEKAVAEAHRFAKSLLLT